MKVALTFAAAAIATAAAFSPVNAATPAAPGHGRYCLKEPDTHTANCSYHSLARCEKDRAGGNGACSLNPKWRAAHAMSHTTTGSAPAH